MAHTPYKVRDLPKALKLLIAAAAVFCLVTVVYRLYPPHPSVPANSAFVEKLKSAKHFESSFPAQKQTINLAKTSSLKHAALNALGMELREVRLMASGSPGDTFAMLSHLGGLGEIIWADNDWTNLEIKLPPTSIPGQVVVPRRKAVRAALQAIKASGGCLIKAGPHRYLVAKVSERQQYEAAIRGLGWLAGTPPPWVQTNADAEPRGPANRSQSVGLETNRTSAAAGSGR